MHVDPLPEHRWLENLLGEWTMEADMDMGPDKPREKTTGKEVVRQLGEIWIVCDGHGKMDGRGLGVSQMTLGYDPRRKCFVGTFIGSLMTHLWIYENGTLDDAGRLLTLNTIGPSFTKEAMVPYQDTIEIVDQDHRVLRSYLLDDNEVWQPFMIAHYHRQK